MLEHKFPFLETALNLPTTDFQIKEIAGKLSIFDALRKKFLILTPEEWVRQHIIFYLVSYKNYPKSLITLERGVKYNTLHKRFDLLVMDRLGNPFLLVECKAPEIKLTQLTVEQVSIYNKTIGAPYMVITNGKQHICMGKDPISDQITQLNSFPDFPF
ncbi:type I restriction enzyme HsdR N-terminal domain-containing protein [Anditalea andensis]|uniref:Type I restriction enzyme R protein n=1 Tax=Anditalea andensis TaxID=1048983 RepID=A0A074KXY8_9BACT|nr:type I restriction enzyme HsdR N-terminal domain-containing protein [Anditalea andensis]KEO74841.1 type I restriction enzyme R protein [Anditalea andensis]